jgi:hypothetical protein
MGLLKSAAAGQLCLHLQKHTQHSLRCKLVNRTAWWLVSCCISSSAPAGPEGETAIPAREENSIRHSNLIYLTFLTVRCIIMATKELLWRHFCVLQHLYVLLMPSLGETHPKLTVCLRPP